MSPGQPDRLDDNCAHALAWPGLQMGSCWCWGSGAGPHAALLVSVRFINPCAGSSCAGLRRTRFAFEEETMLKQQPRVWCFAQFSHPFGQSPHWLLPWSGGDPYTGCQVGVGPCCHVKSPAVWRGQGHRIPAQPSPLAARSLGLSCCGASSSCAVVDGHGTAAGPSILSSPAQVAWLEESRSASHSPPSM